jgi:hypothetical protein
MRLFSVRPDLRALFPEGIMDDRFLMIALRLFHIVGGVFWVGAVMTLAWFVGPSTGVLGEATGRFFQEIMIRRKLSVWIASAMGLTLLSGLAMYGRYSMVANSHFASSRTGIVLGIGALFAIVAAVIGGSVAGKTAKGIAAISHQIQAAGGRPTDEQKAQIMAMQARQGKASRIAAALLLVTLIAMASARYV